MDVQTIHRFGRNIGTGIRDDGDLFTPRVRRLRLRTHVVGLLARHRAEACRGFEQPRRFIEMSVDAHLLACAGDDQARDRHGQQGRFQRTAIDRFAADDALGAITVAFGVFVAAGGIDAGRRQFIRQFAQRRAMTGFDELVDAFEQIDETERTSIDHAGRTQGGELVRRVSQRFASHGECVAKPGAEVAAAVGLFLQRNREGLDHAEDGAFARLGHGLAGQRRAARHGTCQGLRRQPLARAQGFGHPLEKLRDDGAGVATRAVDGLGRSAPQHFAGTRQARCTHTGRDRTQREREIGAGVAIRHRKDIDAIDLVATRNDALDTRHQGPAQTVAGQALHADLCSHA